jgi:hypothetical protein
MQVRYPPLSRSQLPFKISDIWMPLAEILASIRPFLAFAFVEENLGGSEK